MRTKFAWNEGIISLKMILLINVFVLVSAATDAQTDRQLLINSRSRTNTGNVADDEKGQVGSLSNISATGNLLSLGSEWKVTECCGWSGTWKRRPNTNTFDGFWKHTNGTVVTDVIELKGWNTSTNMVTLFRPSNNGTYKATYVAAGKSLVNGTASWYPAGLTWSAIIVQ